MKHREMASPQPIRARDYFDTRIEEDWDKLLHTDIDFAPKVYSHAPWERILKGNVGSTSLIPNSQNQTLANPRGADKDVFFSSVPYRSFEDEGLESLQMSMKAMFNSVKARIKEYEEKYKITAEELNTRKGQVNELELKEKALMEENIIIEEAIAKRIQEKTRKYQIEKAEKSMFERKSSGLKANDAQRSLQQELIQNTADNAEDEVDVSIYGAKQGNMRQAIMNKIHRIAPLYGDVRRIEASFGGVVASFFAFYRWMFIMSLVLLLVVSTTAIFHITHISQSRYPLDVIVGFGMLPGFMYISTFQSDEAIMYVLTVLAVLGLLLLVVVVIAVSEDRNAKHTQILEDRDTRVNAKAVLMRWDNWISSKIESETAVVSHIQTFRDNLNVLKAKGLNQKKTRLQIFVLYGRKVCGFITYILLQFAVYVWVSDVITSFTRSSRNNTGSLAVGYAIMFIPPVILSTSNCIFPYFVNLITDFERWESKSTELNIKITRLYFASFLNILILAVECGLIADPFFLSLSENIIVRENLEPAFVDRYECRLNMVNDSLTAYIVADALVHLVFISTVPLCVGLISKLLGETDAPKTEFDLVWRMISTLYFIGLVILSIPFVPLAIVLFSLIFAIRLKADVYFSIKFASKPANSLSVHKFRQIYAKLIMLTVVSVGVLSLFFFMSRTTFAKDCDIQDDYVGLCLSDLDSDNICSSLDKNNRYFDAFNSISVCSDGYPRCICNGDLSCGPFKEHSTALAPLQQSLTSYALINFFWSHFIEGSVGTWALVTLFFIEYNFRTNSYREVRRVRDEKEIKFTAHVNSLNAILQQQQATLNKLNLINDDK